LKSQQFSFWRRSAAVSAASSDGVSPFEATWGRDAPLNSPSPPPRFVKAELLQTIEERLKFSCGVPLSLTNFP
jgi:hypothetical protein